jgi:hypothetical protein
MPQSPVVIVLVYNPENCEPETLLAWREAGRMLSVRARADRLYDLGEYAAAAELLSPSSVN